MNYEITIPLRNLLAVRFFTAKSDSRSMLNGVTFQDDYIFGTDGYLLGAIRCHLVKPIGSHVIIPNDAIDYYAKKAKRSTVKDVTIRWNDERSGELTNGVVTEVFKGVDAMPVTFQRVMATNTKAKGNPQFQAEYLLKFEKAAKELGRNDLPKIVVLPDGEDKAARVIIPGVPQFWGSVMQINPKKYAGIIEEIQYYEGSSK